MDHTQQLQLAQLNAEGNHYEYTQVPPERFVPYQRAAPYVLQQGEQFTMQLSNPRVLYTVRAGATVWLHNVTGSAEHPLWRVYAARTGAGQCFTLSAT